MVRQGGMVTYVLKLLWLINMTTESVPILISYVEIIATLTRPLFLCQVAALTFKNNYL